MNPSLCIRRTTGSSSTFDKSVVHIKSVLTNQGSRVQISPRAFSGSGNRSVWPFVCVCYLSLQYGCRLLFRILVNFWNCASTQVLHFLFIWSKVIHSAVNRIQTWVIAATTQCTNHYTIKALIQFSWTSKRRQNGLAAKKQYFQTFIADV